MNYKELFAWRYNSVSIDLKTDRLIEEIDFVETPTEFAPEYNFDVTERAVEINQLSQLEYIEKHRKCVYCSNVLQRKYETMATEVLLYCNECGWGKLYGFKYHGKAEPQEQYIVEKILKKFDINSNELSFEELGKYMINNTDKITNISSRKFEELIGDIYQNQGYTVILTQATRDKGKDLILLSNGVENAIIEAKRYSNTIGVDVVRKLRGVQLIYGHKKAILVGSNRFSKDAIRESNLPNAGRLDFELELVDLEMILRMLNIYDHNETLETRIDLINKSINRIKK